MPEEHYRSLASLEDHYWWHQTRYRMAWMLLTKHARLHRASLVADVGCGTGGFLRFLREKEIEHAIGFECSDLALRFLRSAGIESFAIDLDARFRLEQRPFDVIAALDVMEHLGDDATFLDSVRDNLKPDGILLLTVPAHSVLFSAWDRRLNHFRRYSRQPLERLLEANGFEMLSRSYFFSFLFPLALLRKWAGSYDGSKACEFPPVPAYLNRVLLRLGALELGWLRLARVPFGTSLFAVARRRP